MPSRTYTATQAAELLKIKPVTVRYWAAKLKIGRRFGPAWMFSEADLTRLRARNTTAGRQQSPDALPASVKRRATRAGKIAPKEAEKALDNH